MPLTTNTAESSNIRQQKNSSSNTFLHSLTVALNLTIQEKEPTDIEWLNINDMIKHLKNGGYIVKLNENGRINIWTSLEYAQYGYAQQEKK